MGQVLSHEERLNRLKTIERLRDEGLTWQQIGDHLGIAKTAAESWYTRQDRLRCASFETRSCMCCKRPFDSEGIHNRLCSPCKQNRTPSPWEVVEGASRRAGRL